MLTATVGSGAAEPAPAWPHGDPNAVVREVLAQPAYHSVVTTTDVAPKPNLWELLWNWIVDRLRDLLRPLSGALSSGKSLGTVLGLVLVGLSLVGLAIAIFRLALAFVLPRAPRYETSASSSLGPDRSAAEWRRLAFAAAATGDYARAIAALFAAALAALDQGGIVPFDAARTPGEYRRLVRGAREPAALPFDELTEKFVHATYAAEPPAERDFAVAAQAFGRLEPHLE